MKFRMGTLRPQIFVAILCLTIIAVYSIFNNAEQIAALAAGSIAPLAMKLLERE
mgnify:FL=1|tara:strand:- start:168 stop:329 length:162 start_codon:yes stop_codon:yes gene_type:complete